MLGAAVGADAAAGAAANMLPYIILGAVAAAVVAVALLLRRRSSKVSPQEEAERAAAAEALAAWEKAADPTVDPEAGNGSHRPPGGRWEAEMVVALVEEAVARRTVSWASAPPTEPRAAATRTSAALEEASTSEEEGRAASTTGRPLRKLKDPVSKEFAALHRQVQELQAQLQLSKAEGAAPGAPPPPLQQQRVGKRGLKLPPLRPAAPAPVPAPRRAPQRRAPPPREERHTTSVTTLDDRGEDGDAPLDDGETEEWAPRSSATALPRGGVGGGRAVLEAGGRAALSLRPPPRAPPPREPIPPPTPPAPQPPVPPPRARRGLIVSLANASQIGHASLPHVVTEGDVDEAATALLREELRAGGRTATNAADGRVEARPAHTADLNRDLVLRATALAQRSNGWMPKVARNM